MRFGAWCRFVLLLAALAAVATSCHLFLGRFGCWG